MGAGKTTMLWEAAQTFMARGLRVGLITNDQAPDLVDTALLARNGVKVSEVAGSCFCCNFEGLIKAMDSVRAEADADVLIAEPVGSCTDLSATIIQPLKERLAGDVSVAPLSVLADPARLTDILNGGTAGMHPGAAYIFRKQMEEADIIVINKIDLITPEKLNALKAELRRAYPAADVMTTSAKTGEGIGRWIDEVMQRSDAGGHLAEVDYDIYAEGEEVLGWLNAAIALRAGAAADWKGFAADFLRLLSWRFERLNAPVGHVKIILETGNGFLAGNMTGMAGAFKLSGVIDTFSIRGSAGNVPVARLIVNARVQMPPEDLESVVRDTLEETCKDTVTADTRAWRSLSPGRPNPTHRYGYVVKS